jgi:hypothetical protein
MALEHLFKDIRNKHESDPVLRGTCPGITYIIPSMQTKETSKPPTLYPNANAQTSYSTDFATNPALKQVLYDVLGQKHCKEKELN